MFDLDQGVVRARCYYASMNLVPEPDQLSAVPRKSCDGRCQGSCPKRPPRCLVVTACGGVITVLQREGATLIPWLALQENIAAGSPQAISDILQLACEQRAFSQMIIVGSPNDLAWLRASLPANAQSKLVAEINYPLLPEWLREPTQQQLIAALTPLIQ